MQRVRRVHFWALLVIAVFVHFYRYSSLTLSFTGPITLDLIEFEDKARSTDWSDLIKAENDPFVTATYSDRDYMMVGYGVYNFCNLPLHFFYKALGLHGASLWLASKFLTASLGVVFILLVYGLAGLLFNRRIAFLAGLLAAFSPHFWATFHVCGNIDRSYNLTLSTLAMLGFVRGLKKGGRAGIWICGIALGLNYLFFNIGSPMMPFILIVYALIQAGRTRSFRVIRTVGFILAISLTVGLIGNLGHTLYMGGHFNPWLNWVKEYMAWGSSASHSKDGMMFLHPFKFFVNIKDHVCGVFLNGRTSDWHTNVSLPDVPMAYNVFASLLFLMGITISLRRRRSLDLLVAVWFLVFFVIYCMIFVRQKNIVWELVAIFLLAARGVPWLGLTLHKAWSRFSRRKWHSLITWVLAFSTMISGAYWTFGYLPQRNFYDASSYMGIYQLHRILQKRGMDDKSLVLLTRPQINVGMMMLRLFNQRVARLSTLEEEGVSYPPDAETWRAQELDGLKKYDRIHFCFLRYDNKQGNIYTTDDEYLKIFERLHPSCLPRTIKGFDGSPIWRIFTVTRADMAALAQVNLGTTPSASESPAIIVKAKMPPMQFTDRLVSSTFKTLGRTFLSMADFDELKAMGLKKVRKMSEEKWKKRFAAVYDFLKDLPDDLKSEYHISDKMTREDVLRNIEEFDKETALELIDVIPNELIAGRFRAYLDQTKEASKDGNVVTLIRGMWQKALVKLQQPAKEKS